VPRNFRDQPQTFIRDKFCHAFPLTSYSSGTWMRFNGIIWEAKREDEVMQEVQDLIDSDRKLKLTASSSVLKSITELIRIRVSKADGAFDKEYDLVTFADCTYQISTHKILKHDSHHFLTSAFPFKYDPYARSDVWDMYLHRVFSPECHNFMQEFSGLALTTDTRHEIAVWLYGLPGCGKSTFIEGLQAALGNRAMVLGISDIENSAFGLTNLPGKTLAISTEQPEQLRAGNTLIQLISGERIVVNRKYKDPYEVVPHVKVLWAMNEFPAISKSASGLSRRIKVIEFPELPETERKSSVKEQVKMSGQAIFNWALAGLYRLQERGHFVIPDSIKSASQYRLQAATDSDYKMSV
jgi:putative DNA primase/helicase